jgi:hypothetical protein
MGSRHGAFCRTRLSLAQFLGACATLSCAAFALTACNNRSPSEDQASSLTFATGHMPQLPGTDANDRQAGGRAGQPATQESAEGFNMARSSVAMPPVGALLPPVLHSAD